MLTDCITSFYPDIYIGGEEVAVFFLSYFFQCNYTSLSVKAKHHLNPTFKDDLLSHGFLIAKKKKCYREETACMKPKL